MMTLKRLFFVHFILYIICQCQCFRPLLLSGPPRENCITESVTPTKAWPRCAFAQSYCITEMIHLISNFCTVVRTIAKVAAGLATVICLSSSFGCLQMWAPVFTLWITSRRPGELIQDRLYQTIRTHCAGMVDWARCDGIKRTSPFQELPFVKAFQIVDATWSP